MISIASLILAQTPAAAPQPPSSALSFIPLIAMVVIFYFLLIRPQQKRQKELRAMIDALKTGDKVVTSGGIHGIISNVKEGSTLSLKIADNVKIEVDKSAIASVERTSSAASLAKA